jgi:hypothetical protein
MPSMTVRRIAPMLLVLSAVACDASPAGSPPIVSGGDHDDLPGDVGESSEGSTSGTDVPEPADSSSSAGDSEGPRFDVPVEDVPVDRPCREVDLLFVIDNSGSMADEQANLIASFPGFIDGIEHTLGPQTSYHVGVVTTDLNLYNDLSCQQIGALTTKTGGDMSSASECGPYADGARFMTTHDDLADTFACAAQVGIDGNGLERPMDALEAALHGHPPETAACNDGFLRSDALLVLVLITYEEDEGDSQGDPQQWYDRVVEAKGDPEEVVVLALVGHEKPNDCIAAQWTGMQGAEISPRLIDFAQRFPYGFVRDICSPSYADAFADAVDGIDDACSVPVG